MRQYLSVYLLGVLLTLGIPSTVVSLEQKEDAIIVYPLKQRRSEQELKTEHWTLEDLSDKFALTFSQDSPPKPLEPFVLRLTETDGSLPDEPSLASVTAGLEAFLKAELNHVLAPVHRVQEVDAKILQQRGIPENNVTELVTKVSVSFFYEPSPELSVLELWMESIMAELTYLVSNITHFAEGDVELDNLKGAKRAVYTHSDWSDIEDVSGVQEGGETSQGFFPTSYLIPTIVGGAAVVMLIAFLAIHRSRRQYDLKQSKRDPAAVSVIVNEDDRDVFSVEAGLVDSPAKQQPSPDEKVINTTGSDIFSGLDSQVTSPLGEASGIFSFMSNWTGRSEVTEPINNTTNGNNKRSQKSSGSVNNGSGLQLVSATGDHVATPRSMISSLFAFSEEGETDDDDDEEMPVAKISPRMPFDEADNPDAAEDLLMDTASMNSEGEKNDVGRYGNYDYQTGVFSHPAQSEESDFNVLNANTHTNDKSGLEESKETAPKKSWFRILSPRSQGKKEQAPDNVDVNWDDASLAKQNAATAAEFVEKVRLTSNTSTEAQGTGRHHTQSMNTDGSTQYQSETMIPNPDWSADTTVASPTAGTPEARPGALPRAKIEPKSASSISCFGLSSIDHQSSIDSSAFNNSSSLTTHLSRSNVDSSFPSENKSLINDLTTSVDLLAVPSASTDATGPLQVSDSLSFQSDSGIQHPSISTSSSDVVAPTDTTSTPRQAIVCRDCLAPPGKLKIIIHSTKDGPAVHTVKEGSVLEGQIFPGDLIISVDTVDTRSYSAEQVMKMMTARTGFERKITVLHFEEE